MADEPKKPEDAAAAVVAAPVVAAEPSPAVATPASEPVASVADSAPAAAPAVSPAAEAPAAGEPKEPAKEPAKDAAKDAPKEQLASERPSLLETFDKKDAAKDAAKPTEAKPADAKPVDPAKPAETPIEYKYTLPETLTMDDALKGEVHSAFDAFRANPAEGAQALIDLHAKSMQQFAEQVARDQHKVFNQTRDQWNKEIMADPVIGGAGHLTAMGAVARMRDMLVPSEMMAPRKWGDGSPRPSEFEEFLRITGAGDHRVFNRILHNAARFFDEPQARDMPTEIKPPKGNGRAPKGGIYNHPSSANMES